MSGNTNRPWQISTGSPRAWTPPTVFREPRRRDHVPDWQSQPPGLSGRGIWGVTAGYGFLSGTVTVRPTGGSMGVHLEIDGLIDEHRELMAVMATLRRAADGPDAE